MVFPFTIAGQGVVRSALDTDFRHLEWHGGPDLRSFYEACQHAHRNKTSKVLVADLSGFPIGQVVIIWSGKESHPHFPDLQSLRVHPAFRGMGVGTRLLAAAEFTVAKQGFAQAGLSVGLDNPHARRLYERLGYHATGAVYDDHWSYINQNGVVQHNMERVMDLVKEVSQSLENDALANL